MSAIVAHKAKDDEPNQGYAAILARLYKIRTKLAETVKVPVRGVSVPDGPACAGRAVCL